MAATLTVRGVLALLGRNADYRRLFLATLVSMMGDWFAFVAISGFVTEATGSLGASAAVFAASVLPMSLLSPVAGVLADRVDRRRLMIAVDLLRVVPALGMLAALAWRLPALALGCVALLAALSAFFDPVSEASVPNVVDPEDLPLAQAALGSVWGSMLFVGAALGGLATLAFGREVSLLLNASTFLVSAGLLWGIRRPFQRADPDAAPSESPWRQLGEVWRTTRDSPPTRALLTTKVGVGLGNGIVGLLPAYAARAFATGDEGVGVLLAARGLGAMLGPLLGQRWVGGDERRLLLVCGGSMVTYGLAYLLLPWAPSLPVATLCVLLAHLGGGAQWVLSTYGLQLCTPDRLRGRVMGLDSCLATLCAGASALAASAAAEALGLHGASWAMAGVSLLYGLGWLWRTRGLWRGRADVLTASRPPEAG
ncbi:MFS transporter [Archangium primigenium]|uniref:MFS transporter n=1 Tax=[Archangium] primigenium TaxID=2792470 RepID=UPI00195CBDED|nr:MFS transporter [Archangium primigenium]MBM7112580.1 MFS transporter [Archangium primigenium]